MPQLSVGSVICGSLSLSPCRLGDSVENNYILCFFMSAGPGHLDEQGCLENEEMNALPTCQSPHVVRIPCADCELCIDTKLWQAL